MTTIVAVENENGVTFASDSRVGGRAINDGWVAKVFKNGDLTIGVAGYLRVSQLLKYADLPPVPKGGDPDKLDRWVTRELAPLWNAANQDFADSVNENRAVGNSEALVSVRGRIYELGAGGSWTRSDSGIYAIGSGMTYALGALEAGASPKKAIRIASKYDGGTNDDVLEIKVKAKKPKA